MDLLQSYEFKRPSRSQYTPVVTALVDEGIPFVRMKRGEDFSDHTKIASVRNGVSDQLHKAGGGRTPRTWVEDDDNLIVTFWSEDEKPKPRRRKNARQPVAA
jgi:hypothetical protein